MNEKGTEKGESTVWDQAWREGHARALENLLGLPYRHAYLLARDYWQPPVSRWRVRLARMILKPPAAS